MSTDPGSGGARETSPERQSAGEEQRGPGHADPDEMREDVGLDEEGASAPPGTPLDDDRA